MHLSDFIFNVVDLETTGFDNKKDKVVSIASVWMKPGLGIIEHDYQVVDPGIQIPAEAIAVHHITNKEVVGKPALETVVDRFLGKKQDCFVAHNAKFDFSFLDTNGTPVLCTMRLARKLFPNLTKTTNQFLRYHFDLDVNTDPYGAPHHALADAVVTAHLLMFLLAKLQERAKDTSSFDIQKLVEWVDSPMVLNTCRFGSKHYGKKWHEVPKDYLQWMIKNVSDMDVDTRHTVEYYLKA